MQFLIGTAQASPSDRDASIRKAVESRLWGDPTVPADAIEVRVFDGIVILEGRVTSIHPKTRSIEVARSVVGTKGVVNLLDVDLPTPNDAQLERSILEALVKNKVVEPSSIEVHVSNGLVTVDGTVDSEAERAATLSTIAQTQGTRRVIDHVRVITPGDRSPDDIVQDIEFKLQRDPLVGDRLISVRCVGNTIFLSGSVGTDAERRRALVLAYVPGVRQVFADTLRERAWARDPMQRTEFPLVPEKLLERAARVAFAVDPRIDASAIEVRATAPGTLTLSGVVRSAREEHAIFDDAANIIGVDTVISELTVHGRVFTQEEAPVAQMRSGKKF